MNKQTEALKMASLFMAKKSLTVEERHQLLQACKEALEQPEQEPVTKVFDGAEYEYVGSIQNEHGEAALFYKVTNPTPTIKESLNVEQPAQDNNQPVALNETILTAPKKIYLMVGDEYENNEPFPDNSIDVCWSTGKDFDNDVPYIRADLAHPAPARKPLNEDVIADMAVNAKTVKDLARAVEKAHGIGGDDAIA